MPRNTMLKGIFFNLIFFSIAVVITVIVYQNLMNIMNIRILIDGSYLSFWILSSIFFMKKFLVLSQFLLTILVGVVNYVLKGFMSLIPY